MLPGTISSVAVRLVGKPSSFPARSIPNSSLTAQPCGTTENAQLPTAKTGFWAGNGADGALNLASARAGGGCGGRGLGDGGGTGGGGGVGRGICGAATGAGGGIGVFGWGICGWGRAVALGSASW